MAKKYVSLSKLSTFLENLKVIFAPKSHKHNINDISDYFVDAALSSLSTNPIANCVVDAEFEAISEAIAVLESEIDAKAEEGHNHDGRYLIGTDKNLTQDGVAADAKATGSAISNVQNSMTEYIDGRMSEKASIQIIKWGEND